MVGCVCVVFSIADAVQSFGYLTLSEEQPSAFRGDTNWVFVVNVYASNLVWIALVSMAVRYFHRTWRLQPIS